MAVPSKADRFKAFIDRLDLANGATDRESALALMKRIMTEVEDELVGPNALFSDKMHVYGWEFEWKDLHANPCYWDDNWAKVHRTQIYGDGRIVISKLRPQTVAILDKPGA